MASSRTRCHIAAVQARRPSQRQSVDTDGDEEMTMADARREATADEIIGNVHGAGGAQDDVKWAFTSPGMRTSDVSPAATLYVWRELLRIARWRISSGLPLVGRRCPTFGSVFDPPTLPR